MNEQKDYRQVALGINYAHMVATLAKSGDKILPTMDAAKCHAFHMILGMAGEVGELVEATEISHITEESGDFEFYFEGLRQGYNVEMEELLSYKTRDITDPVKAIQVATSNLVDVVKKQIIYAQEINRARLIDEMRELRYGLDCFYHLHGLTLTHVQFENKVKLAQRYEGFQYSDKAAEVRADKSAGE